MKVLWYIYECAAATDTNYIKTPTMLTDIGADLQPSCKERSWLKNKTGGNAALPVGRWGVSPIHVSFSASYALLPVLALNVGTGSKLCAAELSNMYVICRETGATTY